MGYLHTLKSQLLLFVLTGLVEVGHTWCCLEDQTEDELKEFEKAALLTGLSQKYLTRLSNPRWLQMPLYARGRKDIWTVDIPVHLLPSSSVPAAN